MNHFLKRLPFLFLCGLIVISCSKDERHIPSIDGSTSNDQLIIYSEPGPQKGQSHRSSNDFSTDSLLGDGEFLLWMTDCEEDVSFTLMLNKKGTDEMIQASLSNGSITEFHRSDKLYIADPQNATKPFTITVSRILGNPGSVYVNCAKDHLPDQDHRASGNFSLKYGKKYQVITSEDCSFSIMCDKSAAVDETVMEDVKNGRIVAGFEEQNIYIADVKDASGPFTVEFKPYVQVQSSWMKTIPDNTKVSMMSIPGTHDTGTYVFDLGLARCQNYDIYTQLIDGIRWLDIRLSDDLKVTHTLESNLTFDTVMAQINTFLGENPSEAVFMMIKAGNDTTDFYNAFKKWLNDNHNNSDSLLTSSRMLLDEKMHTLGDIRGKIVLLRRFLIPKDSINIGGIDLSVGWPDDASGTLSAKYDGGEELFYIEDRFFSVFEDDHDTKEKVTSIQTAFDSLKTSDDQMHYLIYNSIAGKIVGRYAWDYAWGASGIDPYMMYGLDSLMNTYYPKGLPGRTGVIMLDYYNKHSNDDPFCIVDRIINTNFINPIIPPAEKDTVNTYF